MISSVNYTSRLHSTSPMQALARLMPPDTRRTQKASCTSAQPMATAILDVGRRMQKAAANVMAVNIESRRRVEIMDQSPLSKGMSQAL